MACTGPVAPEVLAGGLQKRSEQVQAGPEPDDLLPGSALVLRSCEWGQYGKDPEIEVLSRIARPGASRQGGANVYKVWVINEMSAIWFRVIGMGE